MILKRFSILATILTLMISCNYRTPSKVRFERITNINLPDSITVIQDRFEESGPDYGLYYELMLKEKDCLNILEKLENSNRWEKTDNRLEFQKTNDGIIYNILILKDDNKIIYREELI